MKKSVFFLLHDYWHSEESVGPLVPLLFDEDTEVTLTRNPAEFLKGDYDLFVSFKDPVENDQLPTPVWCDEDWTGKFLQDIRNGMGAVLLHAALTDLPEDHPMLRQVIRSTFITHPAQSPLTFVPAESHPVLEGIEAFTFPEKDEHYMMEMLPGAETTLIAYTESVNGMQPGVWVHTLGKGRICCITPGHTTANLTCTPFVRLVKNALSWVTA